MDFTKGGFDAPMISIFTIPCNFDGARRVQQLNAIQSWLRLEPKPEVILIGDDLNVRQVASVLKCTHYPKIERSKHGTPLISDAFAQAQKKAKHDVLCYINADIMLLDGLIEATEICMEAWPQFLLIGQRWDATQLEKYRVDFSEKWREDVWTIAQKEGGYHSRRGEDWFCFKRGLYTGVPPFAVGRSAWDNWLVFDVTKRELPTVDATSVVRAIHQGPGKRRHRPSAEYKLNQRIWRESGGVKDAGYTTSTQWILYPAGLKLRKGRATWRP